MLSRVVFALHELKRMKTFFTDSEDYYHSSELACVGWKMGIPSKDQCGHYEVQFLSKEEEERRMKENEGEGNRRKDTEREGMKRN